MALVDHREYPFGKRDRLKQLRTFCHVARSQNMTKAAELLSLSQPSVSLQIRALEQDFETTLFERRGPHIILTSAGQCLFELAMPLVERMDRLFDDFTNLVDGAEQGELRITTGQSSAAFILPRILKRFRDRHPGIRVKVMSASGREGLKCLRGYEADIMLGSIDIDIIPDDISYRPFCSYDMVLITPLDHPLAGCKSVSAREASTYPSILPSSDMYSRELGDTTARELGIKFNIAMEANGWQIIKNHVEAGLGISLIPSLCVSKKDRVSIIPIERIFKPRSYGILTLRRRIPSLPTKCFINLIDLDHEAEPSFPVEAN